jgi:hypothetical protein
MKSKKPVVGFITELRQFLPMGEAAQHQQYQMTQWRWQQEELAADHKRMQLNAMANAKSDVNEFMAQQAANIFDGGTMLDKLKNLIVARLELDEALALIIYADALKKAYVLYKIPVPEWLPEGMTKLDEFIREKRGGILKQAVAAAKAKYDAVKPITEQRADAKRQLEELQGQLNDILEPDKPKRLKSKK